MKHLGTEKVFGGLKKAIKLLICFDGESERWSRYDWFKDNWSYQSFVWKSLKAEWKIKNAGEKITCVN